MSAGGEVAFAPRWWRLAVAVSVGAVVVLFLTAAVADGYIQHPSAAEVVGASLDLIGAAALLARRRGTTVVLALEVAISLSTSILAGGAINAEANVLTLVALYAYGTQRPAARTVAVAAVATVTIATADCLASGQLNPLVPDIALFTAVTAVSFYVRSQRALMASYRERAEQAEHEQQWTASRAVAAERVRIARELHDIVAHHVSLLVVQAGAVRETLPPTHVTRPVLDSMIDGGRQAMGEMRDMLDALRFEDGGGGLRSAGGDGGLRSAGGGLRSAGGGGGLRSAGGGGGGGGGLRSAPADEAGGRAPQPTCDQIPALVSGAQAAGLPVTWHIDGDAVDLPPGTSLAAYRIVQEALTNAIKHAPGAFTTVRLSYKPDAIIVSVRNGPSPLPPGPGGRAGRGHGIVGMRERAVLAHGTIVVGPTPAGWEVNVRLPIEPAPARVSIDLPSQS